MRNQPQPNQLGLMNSSRLRAIRDKTQTIDTPSPKPKNSNAITSEELFREQINQCLADILATLPANKQRSLFKIRFGISLEELANLPMQDAANLLKIKLSKH